MKVIIESYEFIEVIEREVKGYSTSTRVSVPKSWSGKKVRIILVKE